MVFRTYSQRMLNPYHGVVNVVEIEGADAVTRDGVNWNLFIQGGHERETFADGSVQDIALPDIKFGSWSAEAGLRRAPVRFVTDYERLDDIGGQLLAAVKAEAGNLPFAPGDRYELWLLDASRRLPLALLDSACDRSESEGFETTRWTPGHAARRGFRASHGGVEGACADALARCVRQAAGRHPRLQWFVRDADGSGRGLSCNDGSSALSGRCLGPEQFPPLLLRTDWEDVEARRLAEDFVAWQAPWLLALQTLSRELRARLEQAARRRATLLADLYRTYPLVLDQGVVDAARVEAMLRRCVDPTGESREEPETTFFVTGN